MVPLIRFLRNCYQKLRSTFYEGPEPPERLTQILYEFARTHPKATRREWLQVAIRHSQESYRSGYTRGFEWSERDLIRRDPLLPPEEAIKFEQDYDWTWVAGEPPHVDTSIPEDDLWRLPPWKKR